MAQAAKYRVLASQSLNNTVECVEAFHTDSIRDAFRQMGEWAPICTGVVILADGDSVIAELLPKTGTRPTPEQRARYWI